MRSRQSRLGLRNFKKNEQYVFVLLVFFEIPENLTFGRRLFERGWGRSV